MKPVYYYLVSVIPVLWLPTVLLLPGLLGPWRTAFRERDPRIVMPLIWILLVLVFFSASPGKRGVYLLPLVPMLCLAIAPYLGELLQRRWVALALRGLLAVLAALFIGIAIAAYAGNSSLLEAEIEHGFAPWNMVLIFGLFAAMCRRSLPHWSCRHCLGCIRHTFLAVVFHLGLYPCEFGQNARQCHECCGRHRWRSGLDCTGGFP